MKPKKLVASVVVLLMGINFNLFSQTVQYTFPDETEPHEGTWLQWPHKYEYGVAFPNSTDATWVAMTKALVANEKVHIIAYDATEQTRITNLLTANSVALTNVTFKTAQTNDVWARDNAGVFVRNAAGALVLQDWGFNGWGGDYGFAKDNLIPTAISAATGVPVVNLNSTMTIEGGAWELDGAGTFLATKTSILSQANPTTPTGIKSIRNLGMTQAQAEAILTQNIGATKFIWLDGWFSTDDITDAHIDGFAKFAPGNKLVTMSQADLLYWGASQSDINKLYAATNKNNVAYTKVYIPLTANNVKTTANKDLGYKGSYANYYVANSRVLVPNYNDPNDATANAIIAGLYPGRTVVGIDVRNLYANGGMVHCVTQQQPIAGVVVGDTQAPTAPTNLAAAGTTSTTTNLSWTAATDNVGVTAYDVYQGTTLKATVATTSYSVTGLTASTAYSFTVKAKDAAGNVSGASTPVSVTTTALATDTQVPTAPANLAASGTTATTTNLSWTAATDNVGVTAYDIYQGTTLKATVATTSYSVTGLTASTAYSFTVKAKDAAENVSVASNAVSITTLAPTTTNYCTSKGTDASGEVIKTVAFASINNSSTATIGYENFTTTSTNITKGTIYTITITPQWFYGAYAEGYAAFIDYNNDGDFTDAGETVFTKAASTATTATGNITIPSTATTGSTRMRIAMKYNAIPTACETFPYGQVEDYTVNITTSTARMAASEPVATKSETSFTVFPNPASSEIELLGISTSSTVQIYNSTGYFIRNAEPNLNGNKISIADLAPGLYFIKCLDATSKTVKTAKLIKR
jgi:agmatine/peptidylarginine deiminase/chitodextrinase